MKELVLALLQRWFGFERYLYCFARYKVLTLRGDSRERDFFVFLRSIPKDGIALDIGANLGVMTVHLARHVTGGEIIAFEPMPINVAILRRLVATHALSNVRIEPCALGDREGSVEMVMPVERGAFRHGLSHVVHESITDRNEGVSVRAPLRRLDGFMLDASSCPKGRVTAIKMDVENFEWFVLQGALETIRSHRPLLYIELWPNENRERCFGLLKSLGYETLVCDDGRLTPFDPGRHRGQNFICSPEGARPYP